MEKAIFKFNNGNGALLCSCCRTIIKSGSQFTEQEKRAIKGEIFMTPQTCINCSNMNFKQDLLDNPKITVLAEFLEKKWEGKAFIVGGWVRDLILNVESDDIDIVVEGNGIAFAKAFAEFIGMSRNKVVVFERFGTAKLKSAEWDLDLADKIELVKERDNLANWKNPIKGDWLVTQGMKPGPQMGVILADVKEAIMEGMITNDVLAAQAFANRWMEAEKMK